jgi:hypothetical protein
LGLNAEMFGIERGCLLVIVTGFKTRTGYG